MRHIPTLQQQAPTIARLRECSPNIVEEGDSKYALQDDFLYKLEGRERPLWKTYISVCIKNEIILNFHTGLANSGVERVILAIQEHLHIKRLANKERKWVSQCVICQRAKPMNVRYDVEPQAILRDKPRALVAVDSHVPLPTSNFGC